MSNVYVYETDSGMDLFLSHRALTTEEIYCPDCDEYSKLLTVTTDINKLISLFPKYGYTPNTTRYKDLIEEFNEILGGANGRFYN